MCDCWADLPSEVEWNLGTWLLRGWSPRGYLHLWSPVQFNMDTFPMSYCFVIKRNTFPQSFPNHLVLLNFSTCNSSCETFSAVTWGDRTLGGAFLNTGNQDMVLLPKMSPTKNWIPTRLIFGCRFTFEYFWHILMWRSSLILLFSWNWTVIQSSIIPISDRNALRGDARHRVQSPKSISTLPGRFWQCSYWYLCDFYLLGVIRCFRIL